MKSQKKRGKPRVNFKVNVSVENQSRLQQFYSRNLSSGGIFLEIPGKPPAIGNRLKLSFEIPGVNQSVTVDAEVIYHHRFETMDEKFKKRVAKHGIGLKFLNLSKEDESVIHQYVTGKAVSVHI